MAVVEKRAPMEFYLGLKVKIIDGYYGTGTVTGRTEGHWQVERPYIYFNEVTGISYIGIERIPFWTKDTREWEVYV